MKKLTTWILVAVCSVMLSGVAAAAPKDKKKKGPNAEKTKKVRQTPEERFKKLDTDGNDSLSLDEFKAGLQAKKDKNKAGKKGKGKKANGDKKAGRKGKGKKANGDKKGKGKKAKA